MLNFFLKYHNMTTAYHTVQVATAHVSRIYLRYLFLLTPGRVHVTVSATGCQVPYLCKWTPLLFTNKNIWTRLDVTDRDRRFDHHKSTFEGTLRGISFISVLMHSDSARTVVMIAAMTVVSHQEAVLARLPFTVKHIHAWIKYIVVAKSQHCLVRWTTYHRPTPLQTQVTYTICWNQERN